MLSVAALALLIPLVATYDLAVGLNNHGTKIFDENRQASPAIWRQKENVTVEAPANEVIVKVLVIDMRPEKDGEATVVDGGENQKSVTIELKSPTALRGYDFHIEVYAAPAEGSTETESTETYSDATDLPTDVTSPTVKCSEEGIAATEESVQTESTGTIREARKVIENESNDTEMTYDQNDTINNEATTESEATTPLDMTTTEMPNLQSTDNIPDFPLTGMEGDETRHVRKIGDDLLTSTVDTLYPTMNMDSTIAPTAFDGYDVSTLSDISTTQQSDEAFTVPPNTSNGKDIPDFDDLLSTDGEESRFVRHVGNDFDANSEEEYKDGIDTTTNNDFSTTETGETTTLAPMFSDSENQTRNSREAVLTTDEANVTTDIPPTTDEENQMPPLFQMIGNGDYNINETTVDPDEDDNVTESSGDFTTDINDTTMPPGLDTTVTSDSFTEEQLRVGRGIIEENDTLIMPDMTNENVRNYPLFIDPAVLSKPNASDDYVYVPILAVISKKSYPAFRGALDNISMNVAFPNNNLDTNTAVEQQIGFEMPDNQDTEQEPTISVT